jgi:hypothetical protein
MKVITFSVKRPIPPKTPMPVVAIASEAIDIEKIFVSHAGTPGGAGDWIINDVLVDGRSQLRQKDLPGYLFANFVAPRRASSALRFDGLDVVEQGKELRLVVTYVGPNPEGVPFIASVIGTEPNPAPSVLSLPATARIAPTKAVRISARLQTAAFRPELLEIDGVAHDWVVNDICINGRSQFAQAGDVPGDMFATHAIDGFVSWDTCLAGNAIEIVATYIGDKAEGECFVARLEGEIAAIDPANPPGLRALVTSTEDAAGEVVIATKSPRPRPRSRYRALEARKQDLTVADLVDQCSELVATTKSKNLDVEARLVTRPDCAFGRALIFFAVTADGKRAEISPEAIEALLRF